MARPLGALSRHPRGRITPKILWAFDHEAKRAPSQIASKLGTSRQLVYQVLMRWRGPQYREWRNKTHEGGKE